jgi:hypothetical protein
MKHKSMVLSLVPSLAPAAHAQIILVDHLPHPYGGLASDTLFCVPFGQPVWQRVADNFMPASPDHAVALSFWGFYNEDNPPQSETFRLRIYGSRSSDGLPDDNIILSETTVQNPPRTWTGAFIGVGILPKEYRFEASFAAPVSLDAATQYWLEVAQIGDLTTAFRWEDSVAVLDGVATINTIHNYWQATFPNGPADAAFQLISPEPASLAMLAMGFDCLWRRRRSSSEASNDFL